MLTRLVTSGLAMRIIDGVLYNNLRYFDIIQAYPTNPYDVVEFPRITLSMDRYMQRPFSLGDKRSMWRYRYFVDVFARSKAELDDAVSAIINHCADGQFMVNNSLANITLARALGEYSDYPFSCKQREKYYYVHFNGGYGVIKHVSDFDLNSYTIDIDFSLNEWLLGSSVEVIYTITGETYDGFIMREEDGSLTVNDSMLVMSSFYSSTVSTGGTYPKLSKCYLFFNTSGFNTANTLNDIKLHIYFDRIVYKYSGYIYSGHDIVNYPLTTGEFTTTGALLSDLYAQQTGWAEVSFGANSDLINTDGYLDLIIIPDTRETYVDGTIRTAESSNKPYLEIITSSGFEHPDATLVSNYDESGSVAKGYKLYVHSGDINFLVGFGSLFSIEFTAHDVLATGVRYRLGTIFRWDGSTAKCKMYLNGNLILDESVFVFVPPRISDRDIGLFADLRSGDYFSLTNGNLYGFRFISGEEITSSYVSVMPVGTNDVVSYEVNEGYLSTIYDRKNELEDRKNINLYGKYNWVHYGTKDYGFMPARANVLEFICEVVTS
jgi:hypothetical protein